MSDAPPLAGGVQHHTTQHRHRSIIRFFARFAWFVLFLITSTLLVLGVISLLEKKQDEHPAGKPTAPVKTDQHSAKSTTSKPETLPTKEATAPAPVTPLSQPATNAQPLPKTEEPPQKVEGKDPDDVLIQFLKAQTLAERLPIIETKTPEAELATSCLAKPLPLAPKRLLAYQETNQLEQVTDYYYDVDFEVDDHTRSFQTILVRSRGTSSPKVVVDPFLDLYGGRLADYVAKPSDKAGTFQVIVSALSSCNNPNVPASEKKLTLKLLSRDNTKEIAEAYFGNQSKIHDLLTDGSYSLSYAKAKSCTVMLCWNLKDNPQHPFLEAIAIKALDWNP